VLGFLSVRILP